MKKLTENIHGIDLVVEISDLLHDIYSNSKYVNIRLSKVTNQDHFAILHIGFSEKYIGLLHVNAMLKGKKMIYDPIIDNEISSFVKDKGEKFFETKEHFVFYEYDGTRNNKVFGPFIVTHYIQKIQSNPSSDAAFTRLANK